MLPAYHFYRTCTVTLSNPRALDVKIAPRSSVFAPPTRPGAGVSSRERLASMCLGLASCDFPIPRGGAVSKRIGVSDCNPVHIIRSVREHRGKERSGFLRRHRQYWKSSVTVQGNAPPRQHPERLSTVLKIFSHGAEESSTKAASWDVIDSTENLLSRCRGMLHQGSILRDYRQCWKYSVTVQRNLLPRRLPGPRATSSSESDFCCVCC